MVRAALVVMIMAIMVGVGATLNLLPVSAQGATVTRSINPSTVAPSGEVTVTIRASNYGPAGSIVENFPSGFAWVSSTHSSDQVQRSGEQVTFTLFGETSFSYTLTASSTAGSHTFSGTLTDGNNPPGVHQATGASRVTVQAAPPAQDTPTVTRSINPSTVAPSGEVTVTIRASNYGPAGSIVENFPSGFAWVSSTHPADQVQRSGEQVTFTLFAETSFSYTLTASSTAGPHTFSGTLTDGNNPPETHQVTGVSGVTVGQPEPLPPPPPPTPTDRPGMVSFSMDMPKVGAALTATLSDPNGGVTGTTWQWSRSDTMDGTYTNIANAASASYTPVDDDVDKYLKATASYRDTHRPGRMAEAKTANAVGSATPTTGSALGDHYDSAANGGNGDGQLDTPEMLSAVRDYFAQGSTITVPQMLELVRIYFAG